ncbi:MAG TPA: DoxX family protein [Solirubrobacter sp.]|nr:DoxX family protein [Solirubrobacter sp.]
MELGLLILRVVVGGLFVGHGTQKLFGWFGGHGREGTGKFFESVGLHRGRDLALMTGTGELVGGLLLALGLFVPLATALLTAVMLAAIWTVHRTNGIWNTDGGWEYNAVLIAVAFAVTAIGAGDWSLDAAFGIDAAGVDWALAAFVVGVLGAAAGVALGRRSTQRDTGARTAAAA